MEYLLKLESRNRPHLGGNLESIDVMHFELPEGWTPTRVRTFLQQHGFVEKPPYEDVSGT